jgi:hypothetical protein
MAPWEGTPSSFKTELRHSDIRRSSNNQASVHRQPGQPQTGFRKPSEGRLSVLAAFQKESLSAHKLRWGGIRCRTQPMKPCQKE